LIKLLLRNGVRKGLVGGSRTWLTIGAVAGGIRLLQRMARNEPEVLMCEELPEGAVLVISNKGPAE
jgi:hypothetical protein